VPPGLRTHKAFSNVPWVPKASIATSTPRPSVSSMICSTTSPEIDRKVRAHGLGDREALGHRVDANDGRRARQLRPRHDAGVGERIDQNEVAVADQGRDDSRVGEIAGTEHASRLGALEARQPVFQSLVERMVAGDEPRSAGADAVVRHRIDRRCDHLGMLTEIEIIVAREREQTAAAALGENTVAGRHHRRAAEPRALQRRKLVVGEFIERAHRGGMKAPNVRQYQRK